MQMPVPSSYNDVLVDKKIRDHVGLVWYDRSFFAPESWRQQGYRVFLRFGSVHYAAQVVSEVLIIMYTITKRITQLGIPQQWTPLNVGSGYVGVGTSPVFNIKRLFPIHLVNKIQSRFKL